jgi:type II secretory pathway pseudopilin PulG
MRFRAPHSNSGEGLEARAESRHGAGARRLRLAFTLAEVLAAMAFLAIVIPVVVQCLSIASRAGEVATRKARAARIAQNVLNESVVTTNWSQSSQSGTVSEGVEQYDWSLDNAAWNQDPMRQLTVNVKYSVQGQDYSVQLSTLVDQSTLYSTNN